jgi:beta-galactosidase
MQHGAYEPDRFLFGAAYYAEYDRGGRVEADLDLMVSAAFTVIRVGESVWSTWEPEDGRFEVEWLERVLDRAHERGIAVILGTPTYAVPPWLQVKHPEIAADVATGTPRPWGSRQEIDYSHPTYRRYAERVIRAVVARYATHPAVIGYQVDNEPGLLVLHNDGVFEGFRQRLEARYGSVEALNQEWGLTYWSHRLTSFDELWRPDGNTSPQYDLAWRQYQADLTTEFIGWQAAIVREYASPTQFVTTCIQYPHPALHDAELVEGLDVTAANPYYGMQDHLDPEFELPPMEPWIATGVWGLFRQADRAFSSAQARYLVTETNGQAIAGSERNYPPYPGQLAQAALALVSRGASMIEYWHWHTLHFGTETYWGGVLPHSGRAGRVYREVAELGHQLEKISEAVRGYTPDHDVTLVYCNRSKWALEFMPALQDATGRSDPQSYAAIFDSFYRGALDAGLQCRIVHADHLERSAEELVDRHPVLVVAGLYASTDELPELLEAYARSGGHLVLGIRSLYADDEGRAREAVAPAGLAEPARVWYEEFSNLDSEVPLTGTGRLRLPEGAAATRWADGLLPTGAEVLAGYDHPEFGRFAAITSNHYGAGRVTVVGTVLNAPAAEALSRWLVPRSIGAAWTDRTGVGVTMNSGVNAAGARVWFAHNWSGRPASVTVGAAVIDQVTGQTLEVGSTLLLAPRDARVLLEGTSVLG